MTDRSPSDPARADDAALELASAYLDGETTAAEAAAVEQDPDLLALVARLRVVGEELTVPEPPAGLREQHLEAALGELTTPAGAAEVRSIAAARERLAWYRRVPAGAVAAALVVIALVGAVAVLGSGDGPSTDETAADATSEALAEDAAEYGTTGAGGAVDDALAPSMASDAPSFADLDALAVHVGEVLAGDPSVSRAAPATEESGPGDGAQGGADADTMADAASGGPGCDPVAAAGVGELPLTAIVDAVVSGRAVTAVVVDDAGPRMVVVDDASCDVVDDRRL